ncbi:MAG: amidohydrolase family protein [Gammaproteobacteria bacterium]
MKILTTVGIQSWLLALMAVTASAQSLVIENVTLIDGTHGPAQDKMWVSVQDDQIVAISPGAIDAPDARRIDGTGKYLIPGLMDVHIHLQGGAKVTPEGLRDKDNDRSKGLRALHGYLYSGVTTVFDAGNNPDFIFALREDERAGKIESPRIFATGGIVTYPGSHGSGVGATTVDSWPEAKSALDAHIARKPDILKLTYEERGWGAREMIPKLPIELLQQIVEYYNDRGIRTTVHSSSEFRSREVIFAGVDTLAHPVIQGPISQSFADLMAAKQIPMVTTLTIGENYSRLAESPDYLDQALYQAVLTDDEVHTLKTQTREEYQERKWTWWMKIMTTIAQENVRMINATGGVLSLGTDQTIGPAVHREMELLSDAGISNADILRIATYHGALFLGKQRTLGTIEVGKLADMVLLARDPLLDINNTKSIEMVVKGGEIIDREKLDLPLSK